LTACLFSSHDASAAKRKAAYIPHPPYAAILVDAGTGNIIYQANSDLPRYPASLTKMMTLYLTFEALENGKLSMNQNLRVSEHAASQAKVTLNLEPGDRISVKDLILSLVVRSANDSAVVLGEGVGGDEDSFAEQMTRKARQLGMSHTTFENASGLYDDQQKSTARDLAKLVMALQRDFPQYYPLFSRTSFTYRGQVYLGHNKVTKIYKGCDGLKTGFLRASGFNLASSAVRGGHRIVGVVLGGKTAAARDRKMMQLLDYAFSTLKQRGQKSGTGKKTHKSSAVSSGSLASQATSTLGI